MAALSDNTRAQIWADFMKEMSRGGEACTITKDDLRDAVDAVDNWVDANASSFNSAIPQPARGALSTKQKIRILAFVVRERFKVS